VMTGTATAVDIFFIDVAVLFFLVWVWIVGVLWVCCWVWEDWGGVVGGGGFGGVRWGGWWGGRARRGSGEWWGHVRSGFPARGGRGGGAGRR
ncbi:hypothetical protein RA265_28305, partial [Pseudomonas syringae pv. tagetis]|uniref:hypothetical protein n=1 Tax=Pseudomonas syringae group genomosp. 7 TaxID=251699 RepID=UPI003770033A